jgi:hypothetical protein
MAPMPFAEKQKKCCPALPFSNNPWQETLLSGDIRSDHRMVLRSPPVSSGARKNQAIQDTDAIPRGGIH